MVSTLIEELPRGSPRRVGRRLSCNHTRDLLNPVVAVEPDGRTQTRVVRLNNAERVEGVARILQERRRRMRLAQPRASSWRTGRSNSILGIPWRKRSKRKRRKRKGPTGESENQKMKYFIETYGCQMNVHDSERMAGLLDQAGYERTPMPATLTCSSSTPAAFGSVRKRSSIRGSARFVRRRGDRSRAVVAVAGCVAQQEGEALLKRSHASIDVIVGTQSIKRLPNWLTEPLPKPPTPPPVESTSMRTCRSRWALPAAAIRSRRMSRSSKAATSSVPSAWCRIRAATSGCGRSATS